MFNHTVTLNQKTNVDAVFDVSLVSLFISRWLLREKKQIKGWVEKAHEC